MAAPPRAQVEASPVQPYRYGLESVITPRSGGRWDLSGVDIPSEACAGNVGAWPASCSTTPAPATKDVTADIPYDSAVPFAIYAAARCKNISPADAEATARRRLAMGEARATEEAFWNGVMGNSPTLRDATAPIILAAAASVTDALAVLEEASADVYDGMAVIHAPRFIAPYAARANLIERDGPVLRTPVGNMWAFGAGYDRAKGPAGEADAAADQSWMYATGAVARWRGDVLVNPTGYAALDLVTNEMTVFAERLVMLHRDCFTAAVVTGVAGGGGGGGF